MVLIESERQEEGSMSRLETTSGDTGPLMEDIPVVETDTQNDTIADRALFSFFTASSAPSAFEREHMMLTGDALSMTEARIATDDFMDSQEKKQCAGTISRSMESIRKTSHKTTWAFSYAPTNWTVPYKR